MDKVRRINNCMLLFITSNRTAPTVMEEKQRRVWLVRAVSEGVDIQYKVKLAKYARDPVVLRAWYDHMRAVDLEGYNPHDHTVRPVSAAQLEAAAVFVSPAVRFCEWLACGGRVAGVATFVNDYEEGATVPAVEAAGTTAPKSKRYTPSQLFETFNTRFLPRFFPPRRDEAPWNLRRFGMAMHEHPECVKRTKSHGDNVYVFDAVTVREYLTARNLWTGDFAARVEAETAAEVAPAAEPAPAPTPAAAPAVAVKPKPKPVPKKVTPTAATITHA